MIVMLIAATPLAVMTALAQLDIMEMVLIVVSISDILFWHIS